MSPSHNTYTKERNLGQILVKVYSLQKCSWQICVKEDGLAYSKILSFICDGYFLDL